VELLKVLTELTIGGNLVSDDIHLLDLRHGETQAQWITIHIEGSTPGRRYGHTLTFYKPNLIIFGGNTESEVVNDVWCLNVDSAPFTWKKLELKSEVPPPRVYHSGAQCPSGTAAGMLIIFGGRSASQVAFNDAWGLRRHRNGAWDWVKAPYKSTGLIPISRYQHSVIFVNSKMVIIGGRPNQNQETTPFDVYDTESLEWRRYTTIRRFRHACWYSENFIYIHGGFLSNNHNMPTSTIVRCSSTYLYMDPKDIIAMSTSPMADYKNNNKPFTDYSSSMYAQSSEGKVTSSIYRQEEKKVVRLSNHAHVAMSSNSDTEFGDTIRKVSLDKLQDEPRKIAGKPRIPISSVAVNSKDSLFMHFISFLLKPSAHSKMPLPDSFPFKPEYVIELARECKGVLQKQSMVCSIKTPVKVFGNIYGNFIDLMRFFYIWKAPTEHALEGDIGSFGYIFLGNYIDRGLRGLEVICLLFALKCKYPEQIYLLRGNHEDRAINAIYGFGEECKTRLNENINDPNSVFQNVNDTFAWLPVAVIVEEKVLCIHAGIGPNVTKVELLLKIPRPIDIHSDGPIPEVGMLLDILWSDPVSSNLETGFKKNPLRLIDRIVSYGADKVNQFLVDNKLDLIIRGHEIAFDGFSTFNDGKVITVTSCTNYCGRYNNSACILVISKTFEIIPKVISYVPPNKGTKLWNDDEEMLKRMPPTPPRQRISGV